MVVYSDLILVECTICAIITFAKNILCLHGST